MVPRPPSASTARPRRAAPRAGRVRRPRLARVGPTTRRAERGRRPAPLVSPPTSAMTGWRSPGMTPATRNITHYEVLRRDRDVHESGEFIGIAANTGSASTSYTDHTAQPLRRYRYRVKAVNQHGASQWSRFAGAEIPEVSVDESQRDAGAGHEDRGCCRYHRRRMPRPRQRADARPHSMLTLSRSWSHPRPPSISCSM